MAVMSHHHTAGFRKLREGLKEQTYLAVERGEEIERLIKGFEEEKKLWAKEKAALEQKVQDSTSQRDSVLRNRDLIIEEWKTSNAGLEFAANIGLEASEVAAREVVARLQEAFKKVYPQADWQAVEAEYNAAVDATFHEGNDYDPELQVDDAIDIGDLLGGGGSPTDRRPLGRQDARRSRRGGA
ncbi:uncharacterized protein LOC125493366 [Beta vulgaris subsp. vulgaris]|uniref:uncharacterized protein LOC125493366 n=1 Tax=Beta vulgaris subsp. vulgaris TaxID=3555 RepID=UPI002546D6C8|nr:uncharacterized protein LOC125493366 [Beta vulgaris subsp. vulgaris]